MKTTVKKMVGIAAVAMSAMMMAGCSAASTSSKGNQATGDTIKIGVNMELSGGAGGYGNQEKQGIQMAADQINQKGGINVNGKKKQVKLYIKDNKTSNSTSASVAAQLVNNDKVNAIVGPATTAAAAQTPNITKAGVPNVSPTASDASYTLQKNGDVQPDVFTACYQDNYQAAAGAQFIYQNLKAKRVAVLDDNSTPYGVGLAKEFKKAYKGKVVASQSFQEGDKDFNAILTSFKNKKADAIYVPGYYSEVGLIVKQARQDGINVPIVGSEGMADPKLAQIAGNSNASKVYYTTPFSTRVAAKNPVAKKFMDAFKAKYGTPAPTFSALAYDSVYMIKEAIESEKSADSAKIAAVLAKVKDFDGTTGRITINKQHNAQKPIAVEGLTNGKVSSSVSIDVK